MLSILHLSFSGKEVIGGKKVAMKQENPANLWEFYICLEIQDRIIVDEMVNEMHYSRTHYCLSTKRFLSLHSFPRT